MTTDDRQLGRDGRRDERTIADSKPSAGYSRRSVIQYGLLGSTVVLAGISSDARADPGSDRSDGVREPHTRIAMFPHQFSPGSRFRIERANLAWRPGALDRLPGTYTTHAIAYDFAPSFGAFAFVDGGGEESGARGEGESESEGVSLEPDRRYELATSPTAAVGAGRQLVAVEAEPVADG